MLQFISSQIISKQTVTISGNPNNITRIMNDVVTFLIYIIYFISRNQLERLNKSGLGVDIPYLTCMIINPEIPPVVNLNLSSCYIQFRIPAHLMSSQIKDITAIFRKTIQSFCKRMVLYTLLPSPKRVTIRLSSPSLFNEIVPVPERKKHLYQKTSS